MKKKWTDVPIFKSLKESIWCMSNYEYQRKIWVNHEDPKNIDNYFETTLLFEEDASILLEDRKAKRIDMTDEEYKALEHLYQMVDEYDSSIHRSDLDKEIIEDPKWHKIREYAKEVYDILN